MEQAQASSAFSRAASAASPADASNSAAPRRCSRSCAARPAVPTWPNTAALPATEAATLGPAPQRPRHPQEPTSTRGGARPASAARTSRAPCRAHVRLVQTRTSTAPEARGGAGRRQRCCDRLGAEARQQRRWAAVPPNRASDSEVAPPPRPSLPALARSPPAAGQPQARSHRRGLAADAEGKEGRDASARAWLRELRDVLYLLRDGFDDFRRAAALRNQQGRRSVRASSLPSLRIP
nr:unnamed protein product [Digitaria exilis]